MSRLEVADIFRAHGPAWRDTERGHFSLGQLKVMSAIEQCRSAALGGHSLRCSSCSEPQIAYNSCRNRHCPKCQSSAIAYTNKETIYALLFDIAADPKHLGARIGTTLVLHTWGSPLTHHPHVHGIVPGGGLALDADQWVPCKPGFFLFVRVLSRFFRRRFLEELQTLHRDGQLKFFGDHMDLADAEAFADWLMPPLETCCISRRPRLPVVRRRQRRTRPCAAHLCVPALRRPDARYRDLRAGSAHPWAASFRQRSNPHRSAALLIGISTSPRLPPLRIVQHLPASLFEGG